MPVPEHESLRGQLLIASATLLDPNFQRTVVLVAEHSDEGAMGVVLNRPSPVNAAEAVQPKGGGSVTITTRLVAGGDKVELRVEDTGEGIAAENMAKIFNPFFTTKPEGKGVGLGLAVSYGIVQGHEGELEVASHAGEGTAFTVTLPVKARGANGGGKQTQEHAA